MKFSKALLIIFSIIVFMIIAYFSALIFVEPWTHDFMTKNFGASKKGSNQISMIIIDDKTIEKYRLPLKRSLYADIFEFLTLSKAKVIGFDMILTTLDENNVKDDAKFFNQIKKMDNLVVGFSTKDHPYPDNLEYDYNETFKKKFYFKINDKRSRKTLSANNYLSLFPEPYFNSLKYAGSVLAPSQSNGTIKKIPQIVNFRGILYPSIALRMYALANGTDEITVTDKKITSPDNKLSIPISNISFNGVYNFLSFYKMEGDPAYSHKTYSAADILESLEKIKQGKKPIIDPREFDDKYVLFGANGNGEGVKDVVATAVHNNHPGVDVQATNLDNLINNKFVKPTTVLIDFVVIVILISLTFWIIMTMPFHFALGMNALLIISYIAICAFCYHMQIAINVASPIFLQIITMIFGYTYKSIIEAQNKEKVKRAMGKYISEDIMQDVVKNIDEIKLGGKKANVTVLFADIRGFTSISEQLSPEEISVILNEYFTEIEPIITKYNGVINKFIGDAVMAIFGEPIQDKNHAENAVRCANEMLLKVKELQGKWIAEGKPKIEIGVGINTGDAFVGNIGSEKRLEYTVIGDMVNLASRIESYNKVYKTNFLISNSTYNYVRNIADVIKISEVTIRGKSKKMNIYEVLRLI